MKLNEVIIVESQMDEAFWDDIKKRSKAIQKSADKYTGNVKQTGDAVAGAANALGRAGAETFKQTVARPVSGIWDAGKSIAQGAAGAVQKGYGDVKQGIQTVGQGAATAIGDVGKATGAVASVPQGVARSIKRGYSAGVDAIGGVSDQALAAQKRAAAKQTKSPKAPNFGIQGYAPASVSYNGAQPSAAPVINAVDNLNKRDKIAVHNKLEKELYGNRSDTGRRNLARGQQIKAAKGQTAKMYESKEYKVWGQK